MKNLTFLFLFLTLFVSCKSKTNSVSAQNPINPEQWLSKIKNEEAKRRTADVLEKIYTSTAYSVLEKDSLSSFQVQIANCQVPNSVEHFSYILHYLNAYTNNDRTGRSNSLMKYISNLYQKDFLVSKAALSSMIDTTKIDFGRYFPPYYYTHNDSITNPKNPSKNLLEIEDELIKYMKALPYNSSQEQTDSIGKIQVLLKTALQDSTFFDYGLPKVAQDLNLLVSSDKKFFIYSIYYQRGSNSKSVTAYAVYKNQQKDKTLTREIGNLLEGESAFPLNIFQVKKNNKQLYVVVFDHDGGGIDGSDVVIKAFQIENNEIQLCGDCIDGENIGVYQKSPMSWILPAFDSVKNEVTFNHRDFYGNVEKIAYEDIYKIRSSRKGSGQLMKRMTLKWNGQQFVSLPLKLYCEE